MSVVLPIQGDYLPLSLLTLIKTAWFGKKLRTKSSRPSPKLSDKAIITRLVELMFTAVMIPILKAKSSKQLIHELDSKFIEFNEFLTLLGIYLFKIIKKEDKEDINRLSALIEDRWQEINSFLKKNLQSIGDDAVFSVMFALEIDRTVRAGFIELLQQGISNEKWLKEPSEQFQKFITYKIYFYMSLFALFSSCNKNLSFKVSRNILRTLAFRSKGYALGVYNYARELNIIKSSELEGVRESISIESINEKNIFLADAGLDKILKSVLRKNQLSVITELQQQAKEKGLDKMTMEDINSVIKTYRKEKLLEFQSK